MTNPAIQEARDMIAKLQAMIDNDKKPQGVWEPKEGEHYFYVDEEALVPRRLYSSIDSRCQRILSQGNAFRTKEEAEKEAKRRKVTNKLRKLSDGFLPYWNALFENSWHIFYHHNENKWLVADAGYNQTPGAIYFPSRESAQSAIDALGDELNVLL